MSRKLDASSPGNELSRLSRECLSPNFGSSRGYKQESSGAGFAVAEEDVIVATYCSAKKLEGWHKAKDLYASSRVKAVRGLCEEYGLPFFVLSAKYGLISGEKEISSYDERLSSVRDVESKLPIVTEQVSRLRPAKVVFFGGARLYRELIERACRESSVGCELIGYGIMGDFGKLRRRCVELSGGRA